MLFCSWICSEQMNYIVSELFWLASHAMAARAYSGTW